MSKEHETPSGLKDYPGFSQYGVDTENGRIWSRSRHKYMKPIYQPTGRHWFLTLADDAGKVRRVAVHKLVWVAANGELADGDHIGFKDGDKKNCRLDNLEKCSLSDLIRHITPEQVTEIRSRAKAGKSKKSIANDMSLNYSTVVAIASNRLFHDDDYTPPVKVRKPRKPAKKKAAAIAESSLPEFPAETDLDLGSEEDAEPADDDVDLVILDLDEDEDKPSLDGMFDE